MIFVLDTNILIHWIRETPGVQEFLNRIGAFNRNNYMNISIVSVAELKTFVETAEVAERKFFAPAAVRQLRWVQQHSALNEAALATVEEKP